MKHARPDYDRFQDPALSNPSLLGEGGTPIGEDEPVFILRAQDVHAAATVAYYAMRLGKDINVDPEMAAVCVKWAHEMAKWMPQKHPDMPAQ